MTLLIKILLTIGIVIALYFGIRHRMYIHKTKNDRIYNRARKKYDKILKKLDD